MNDEMEVVVYCRFVPKVGSILPFGVQYRGKGDPGWAKGSSWSDVYPSDLKWEWQYPKYICKVPEVHLADILKMATRTEERQCNEQR